jgi:hypothetical protein
MFNYLETVGFKETVSWTRLSFSVQFLFDERFAPMNILRVTFDMNFTTHEGVPAVQCNCQRFDQNCNTTRNMPKLGIRFYENNLCMDTCGEANRHIFAVSVANSPEITRVILVEIQCPLTE